MFCNLDFNQGITTQDGFYAEKFMHKVWDLDESVTCPTQIGSLVPHLLLEDGNSLRQLLAKICLEEGKSFEFLLKL